MCKSHLNKLF